MSGALDGVKYFFEFSGIALFVTVCRQAKYSIPHLVLMSYLRYIFDPLLNDLIGAV